MPEVAAVRPAECPGCGHPGARASGLITLVGHGLRERTVLGPLASGGATECVTLKLRRYRCRDCGAVVVSAPKGILKGMLYSAMAVALALSLWSVEGLAGWRVRQRVSPRGETDDYTRWHGWRSLSRWARRAEEWWTRLHPTGGTAVERALSVATQLAGHAVKATGTVLELACDGALRA